MLHPHPARLLQHQPQHQALLLDPALESAPPVLHALEISLSTKLVSELAELPPMDPALQVLPFPLASWAPFQTATHTAERQSPSSVPPLVRPLKQLSLISAWDVRVTPSISPTSPLINLLKKLSAVLKPLGTSMNKSPNPFFLDFHNFDILISTNIQDQVKNSILILLDITIATSIKQKESISFSSMAFASWLLFEKDSRRISLGYNIIGVFFYSWLLVWFIL